MKKSLFYLRILHRERRGKGRLKEIKEHLSLMREIDRGTELKLIERVHH